MERDIENCYIQYFANLLIRQICHVLVRSKVRQKFLWCNRALWMTTWKRETAQRTQSIRVRPVNKETISKRQGDFLNREQNMFFLEEYHCNQSNCWTEKTVPWPWFGRERNWASPRVYGYSGCRKQSISTRKSVLYWKMRSFYVSRWPWLLPT